MKDIVLAVNYRPEVMVAMLKETEEQFGIKITFSVESEPLGTGQYTTTSTHDPPRCDGVLGVGHLLSSGSSPRTGQWAEMG